MLWKRLENGLFKWNTTVIKISFSVHKKVTRHPLFIFHFNTRVCFKWAKKKVWFYIIYILLTCRRHLTAPSACSSPLVRGRRVEHLVFRQSVCNRVVNNFNSGQCFYFSTLPEIYRTRRGNWPCSLLWQARSIHVATPRQAYRITPVSSQACSVYSVYNAAEQQGREIGLCLHHSGWVCLANHYAVHDTEQVKIDMSIIDNS